MRPGGWRPLILSNLSVPLLGIVDTAVVGHLPEPHYLGAVAIGALTFNVLYFVFGFLRMGTTGLTAQAFGRADTDELRAGLVRALLLGATIALLLIAAGPLIIRLAILLFEPTARVAGVRELRRHSPAERAGRPRQPGAPGVAARIADTPAVRWRC